MRGKIALAAALVTLLLAACGPFAAPGPTLAPAVATATAPQAATVPTSAPGQCTVSSTSPTAGPTEVSLFPPVSQDDWVRGAQTPSVTFLEYSDFQCPYCAALAQVLAQLLKDYPQDVRVVFRPFPLSIHDKSTLAAQAAEAAGLQGKFWEMHDRLFETQDTWVLQTPTQFEAYLQAQATDLGLNAAQFASDLKSSAVVQKVQKALDEGNRIQIPGTPLLLINGKIYSGLRDYQSLSDIVSLTAIEKKQYATCPPVNVDPQKQYVATLHTEKGDIVVQLYPDKAPMAVSSFIFLAKNGWYDGVTFHRVLPGYIAQSGDPTGTGYGGPGYAFDNEISDLKFDKAGVFAMANSGPGSNGSQFFITYAATPNLDGLYTIFGQVIQGMDVVNKLTPRDPSQNADLPPGDKILSVTIVEK